MADPTTPASLSRNVACPIAVGALIAVAMMSLSVTGLLGRLTVASVGACIFLAIASGFACARWLGLSGPPRLALASLPFLVPAALAAALLPPHAWDDVAYGAALPRDFAAAGRFFYNADYGVYAAFPANYETLVTASLLLTGTVSLSQLLNVVFASGLSLIAVQLARALGASKPVSLLAGIFVLCAPALIRITPLTKNDVANAFFQSLGVLVLVALADRPGYGAALLSGAFVGMSLGIKYSSVHFLLAAAPFVIPFLLRSTGSPQVGLKRALVWMASVGVCAAPWYIRNCLLFANPLFPFMNDAFGAHNGFTSTHSELLRESFDGLRNFSIKTGTPWTFAMRVAKGFGPLPMVLVWPGIFLALRGRPRTPAVLVAGVALVFGAITLLLGYWDPRYFLSLLVLVGALATLPLELLWVTSFRFWPDLGRRCGPALLAVAAGVAVWGGYPLWREHCRNVAAILHEGRTEFVKNHVLYAEVAEWLNTHTDQHDRVAIGFNIQPFYYLKRSYYHISPLTEGSLVAAETPDQVDASLRKSGVTLLAFYVGGSTSLDGAPNISAYRTRLWHAQWQLRKAGRLRQLVTISGVRIMKLESPPPGAPAATEPNPGGGAGPSP